MAYTADKPPLAESTEQLRARIPGWGVDLDPQDRPSVPRERFDPDATGAHWDFPERQPEKWPRERSIEHAMLTPVFGTSCPPKGLSGVIRRYSYAKYSEARAAHWLLLMAADRVDTLESTLRSFLTLRMNQTPVKRQWPRLFEHIRNGYLKPSDIVTHRVPLEHIAEAYHMFSAKLDGCIKPLILPSAS